MEHSRYRKREYWVPIDSFSDYEISDSGNIRCIEDDEIIDYTYEGNNIYVYLYDDDERLRKLNVLELMIETFCNPPDEAYKVYYKDGDPNNLSTDNIGFKSLRDRTKRIRVIETGEIYESAEAYKEATGESMTSIMRAAKSQGRLLSKSYRHLEFID